MQNIDEIANKFEIVSNHVSESQIFFLLNLVKFDIDKAEGNLEETVQFVKASVVNFEESDLLSLIQSLGSVTVQEQESQIQFKRMENHSAQINRPSQFIPTTFQLHKNVSYQYDKGIDISGMCVARDGLLLICNKNHISKDILILSCEGEYIRNLELESHPWTIAIEPDTGDAWVTMPGESFVQVVDTKTYLFRQRISGISGAYGIAFAGNNLAVGKCGKVEIFSKQGSHVKTIECNATNIYSLCYTENMIYCAAADSDKLLGLRVDGSRVFTYKTSDFIGPISITLDSAGNMYVLCHSSQNLHKLTADGKLVDVMLDNKTITDTALTAVFDNNYMKIFIPSRYNFFL